MFLNRGGKPPTAWTNKGLLEHAITFLSLGNLELLIYAWLKGNDVMWGRSELNRYKTKRLKERVGP